MVFPFGILASAYIYEYKIRSVVIIFEHRYNYKDLITLFLLETSALLKKAEPMMALPHKFYANPIILSAS